MRQAYIGFICVCACVTQPLAAADLWGLCENSHLTSAATATETLPSDGEIFVDADSIETIDGNRSKLIGNVVILSELERILADMADYSPNEESFELNGNVRYWSQDLELIADSMTSYSNTQAGSIQRAQFFFPTMHAGGYAEQIQRYADNRTELDDTTYSSCPPNKQHWQFRAANIELDHDKGQGLAKHMRLRIKGVPLFYFPIFSFPIDDRRKTGFLYPSIGSSDKHGFEAEAPFYWNIAPQADATITPNYLRKRGLKLDTEWRGLNHWSLNQLNTEYLDDDEFGEARYFAELNHQGKLSEHFRSSVAASTTSDTEYFNDFGGGLAESGITHLPQSLQINGSWENWRLGTLVQTFQTIDETIPNSSRPYRLLPRLTLDGVYANFAGGFDFELSSSYTAFEQTDRLTARRLDLLPRLSRPIGAPGWFVIPSFSARYTRYTLDNLSDPLAEDQISRSVPIFSLDSGLIFERSFGRNQGLLQTLEPRLFYLNVPFRNQDAIPIFDTSLPDFSFAQLFSENRFVGIDRVGDTEQTAFVLRHRILRKNSGQEILRSSLGQIYYSDDRLVTLPGQMAETVDRSGILGELALSFGERWSTSLTIEWNPELRETDKGLLRFQYKRNAQQLFNLSYRFRRDGQVLAGQQEPSDLEQIDASFSWPLGKRWSVIGLWNRSLEEDLDLERFIGLEYESCCFAIRVGGREYLEEDDSIMLDDELDNRQLNKSIFFQFSLKGLGNINNGDNVLLERSILGYQSKY